MRGKLLPVERYLQIIMSIPNEKEIVRLLLDEYSEYIDTERIFRCINQYKLLWKLREIGEYSAAVHYLAKSLGEQDENEKHFTEFCNAIFYHCECEEQKIAHDAVEIVRSLEDERHFIFSSMLSKAGSKSLNAINQAYACPRGLRYDAIWKVIAEYNEANIADIGCGECRLEEHINLLNIKGTYHFNAADRSSYILVQARHRNRMNDNITYHIADFTNEFEKSLFCFDKEVSLIVVVSEFIEHLTKQHGLALLHKIIDSIEPAELLITTPNRDYSRIYKKDDPNNQIHIYEYPYDDFVSEMHNLASYSHNLYQVSDLYGIAGKPDLPQSLFARLIRRR